MTPQRLAAVRMEWRDSASRGGRGGGPCGRNPLKTLPSLLVGRAARGTPLLLAAACTLRAVLSDRLSRSARLSRLASLPNESREPLLGI